MDYPRREELDKDERIFLQRVVEIGAREVEDIAGGGDGGDDGQRCGKKGKKSSFRQHDDCVVSGDRGLNKGQDVRAGDKNDLKLVWRGKRRTCSRIYVWKLPRRISGSNWNSDARRCNITNALKIRFHLIKLPMSPRAEAVRCDVQSTDRVSLTAEKDWLSGKSS